MRTLIPAVVLAGVLSTSGCGPVSQSAGLDQGSQTARLTIITAKLPTGVVGSYYSVHLAATGGAPPYEWEVAEGSLPPGLVLDGATGDVSGTPTQYVRTTLVLRVEDSSPGEHQESTAMLAVTINPDRLTILNPDLPQAIIGSPYTVTLEAAGGTEPYTWSIKEGSLPGGLELQPQSGVIHGEPIQGGTSVFIVEVTDSSSPPTSVAHRFAPFPKTDIVTR